MTTVKQLVIDESAFALLCIGHEAEEVGAAMLLLGQVLRGREVGGDFRHGLGWTSRRWRQKGPRVLALVERLREVSELRRVNRREPVARAVRLAVYERDGGVCRYCSEPVAVDAFHLDHVRPVALGGSNDPANLAVACAPCNLAKGANLVGGAR